MNNKQVGRPRENEDDQLYKCINCKMDSLREDYSFKENLCRACETSLHTYCNTGYYYSPYSDQLRTSGFDNYLQRDYKDPY